MNELALFAGAGGGILGGHLLGWRTVCAVEHDPYARDVLVARQNDGCLEAFPIWDDVCTFDGKPWRGLVDVVSGGFPCQDISVAGKGAGLAGERSGLWGEMARIIREVRPRFAFVENSPALTGRGLGVVLRDLAEMGMDARWGVLGADDAGAPHRRKRIWIVAHPGRTGWNEGLLCLGGNGEQSSGSRGSAFSAQSGCSPTSLADAASSQDDRIRRDCECGRVAVERSEQAAQQDNGPTDYDGSGGCGEVVANAEGSRPQRSNIGERVHGPQSADGSSQFAGSCSGVQAAVSDADSLGCDGRAGARSEPHGRRQSEDGSECGGWWAAEPDVGGKTHGVAKKLVGGKAHD